MINNPKRAAQMRWLAGVLALTNLSFAVRSR